jgi:hypothetical protein
MGQSHSQGVSRDVACGLAKLKRQQKRLEVQSNSEVLLSIVMYCFALSQSISFAAVEQSCQETKIVCSAYFFTHFVTQRRFRTRSQGREFQKDGDEYRRESIPFCGRNIAQSMFEYTRSHF